jgi:hypothetical protein
MNLHDAHFPGNRKITAIRRFADTRSPVASVLYAICGLFLRLGYSFIPAPFPFGTKEPTIVFDCHDGEITVENRIVPYDPLSGLSEST